jgi:hypothetical protein
VCHVDRATPDIQAHRKALDDGAHAADSRISGISAARIRDTGA